MFNETIESLYQRYHTDMYHAARSITHQHHDAEDAVQTAILNMCEGGTVVLTDGNPRALCVTAAKNAAIDMKKSAAARYEVPSGDMAMTPNPAGRLYALDHVKEYLEALPTRQKDAIWMRVVEGMSFEDVAESIGLSVRTVKQDFKDGMESLRSTLGFFYYWGMECQKESEEKSMAQ